MQLTLKTILMHFNSRPHEKWKLQWPDLSIVSCCLLIYGILNAIYCLRRQRTRYSVLSTQYSGLRTQNSSAQGWLWDPKVWRVLPESQELLCASRHTKNTNTELQIRAQQLYCPSASEDI